MDTCASDQSKPTDSIDRRWPSLLLSGLGQITTHYAKTVIVVVLASTVLAAGYTSCYLTFLTGRNDLLSPDKRYLQLDEEYAAAFHGLEQFVVVAEGPDLAETKAFVRRLADQLQADTAHVQEVFYRIDTSSLDGKKLLLLSPTDLHELRQNVEDNQTLMHELTARPGLNTLLTAINHKISVAMISQLTQALLGPEEAEEPDDEPSALGLAFLQTLLTQLKDGLSPAPFHYQSPWSQLFGNDLLSNDGFLVSDDQHFVFLSVEPRTQGEGFDARRPAIEAIRQHIAQIGAQFPQVQAGVTGEKALENDEMVAAQADSSLAAILSLGGVGLLYLVFFRNLSSPVIIVSVVLVGLTWTMGVLTLSLGHLTIISSFVASILIGLADDRVVYFVSRYEEERHLGQSHNQAIQTIFMHTVPGIVAASGTNALAFYAMMLADFRGIQELGFIAGNGMLLSLIATLTFLPALLTLTVSKMPRTRSVRHDAWLTRGFAWWGRTLQRLWRPVLIVAIGASLACLLALPTTSFDANLLHLQARGTESVTWEQRMIQHAGRSSWYALSSAPSLSEAAHRAAQFEALASVEAVETVASLAPADQAKRLGLVDALQPLFADLPTTLAAPAVVHVDDLAHSLEQMKFKLRSDDQHAWQPGKKPPEAELRVVRQLLIDILGQLKTLPRQQAESRLKRLQQALFQDFADLWSVLSANLHPPGLIRLADVPAQLRSRFVNAEGSQFLLQIYPRQDIWEGAALETFVNQLRQVDPDVTGSPVIGYASTQAIKHGYVQAGVYAAVAIFLLTFLTLRSVSDTLLAMLPVVLGLVWMLGLMRLCQLPFNLANLVVIPITIGIGVESGIYLVQRAREEALSGTQLIGGSTGQSITVFSLSTMVGFGSLMIARHYGIFSMGLLFTLAVGSVLLASLTVLPLVLSPHPTSGLGRSHH